MDLILFLTLLSDQMNILRYNILQHRKKSPPHYYHNGDNSDNDNISNNDVGIMTIPMGVGLRAGRGADRKPADRNWWNGNDV